MPVEAKRGPASGPGPLGAMRRIALALGGLAAMAGFAAPSQAAQCARTVSVDVVTIDQPIVNSRLGVSNVNGMMYALRQDVVPIDPAAGGITALINDPVTGLQRRNAKLRDDKRPRPLVLRVAAGDCLTVNFQNLVAPAPNPFHVIVDRDGIGNDPNPVTADQDPQIPVFVDEQVADRRTAFHASGMQLVGGIGSDGSFVGRNPSSLVAPGASATYRLFAEKEGVFQVVSHGALVGSDANQGNTANGLFGQVIVEPKGARTYRNTVTEEELRLASTGLTSRGQPKLDYEARYPTTEPWIAEGKADRPILNMIDTVRACSDTAPAPCIWHTEIDAVVAGPNADGTFPASTYPLEARGQRNPAYPNRLEPFRDFAQMWHDEIANAQAYPGFYNKAGFVPPAGQDVDPLTQVFAYLLSGVRDKFGINYATGGIGTEILSNRLGVGPMHDCLNCAYEEFFLTHFTVGEVGQLVDIPANAGLETITPQNVINILLFLKNGTPALTPAEEQFLAAMGPKANKAFYPGDPANINHSYTGDFVKFRNTHNGFEQHVFHLHNHQWLFNPNDDNSNYLDAQGIGPGVGYTYELVNGGSGNRNKSSGDAIYHCHFYPHFAQGMWYMWRIHDVYETGTRLAVSDGPGGIHTTPYALKDGTPAPGARALPDGEIAVGTPIPAVVPLPGKPLPPMPAAGVTVAAFDRNNDTKPDSSQAVLPYDVMAGPDGVHGTADDVNPGYPFWVAGVACGPAATDPNCDQGIVGQRPSTPPLDMATQDEARRLVGDVAGDPGMAPFNTYSRDMKDRFIALAGNYSQMHGGLPRHSLHGVAAGGQAGPTIAGIVTPVDLTKFIARAKPVFFPEGGTDAERTAMATHAKRAIPTVRINPDGTEVPASFTLNGLPPVPGAPFSDPCVDDVGAAAASSGSNTWFGGATADATVNLSGGPFGAYTPRIYRGANIQYDAVLNKVGYHYPQQRIVSLWEDALPVITKNKPGEPLVMRLNTTDCAMYHHTNLVPETFEMDDYQVRTPTDIIGQHIHLPKWDLTTTDGAANGWNYEDGTLSPGTIRERIHAINCFNGYGDECHFGATPGTFTGAPKLEPAAHAFFGATGPGGVDWRGARITLQRWFADPVLNTQNQDRGLGIIFTHDHYGPSTFQQIGLYSTVLTEPVKSTWAHNETGKQLGCNAPGEYPALGTASPTPTDQSGTCRADGGPTSWQAIIDTTASGVNGDIDGDGRNDSFREFYFEYTDFQHAYEAGVYVGADNLGAPNHDGDEAAYAAGLGLDALFYPHPHAVKLPAGLDTFRFAIAPPLIVPVAPIFPDLSVELAVTPQNGALSATPVTRECIMRPCPTSIDFLEPGMFVVNYRNEPVALRIFDPNKIGPDGKPGMQADGQAGDLAFAFSNSPVRKIAALNRMPQKGDTATPPAEAVATVPANIQTTAFPPHINVAGFGPRDPYTPMLRAYSGDRVRIKAQAGGDEEEHSWSVHGIKWLQAGSGHGRAPNSGWRNQQAGGISEQFTAYSPVVMDSNQRGRNTDFLYMMDAHQDGFWTGNWGILRSYDALRADLAALPNNPEPLAVANTAAFGSGNFAVCPSNAPRKTFDISAVLANDALPAVPGVTITPTGEQVLQAATPGNPAFPATPISSLHAGGPLPGTGTLVYNARTSTVKGTAQGITVNETGPLHDPTAILYVLNSDLDNKGKLKPGVPVEPLVLRVNAGDCVVVNLTNRLPKNRLAPDLPNYNEVRHAVKRDRLHPQGSTTFQNNLMRPSSSVGFHTQLMEYDMTRSDGTNVGNNPTQTAAPGNTTIHVFYAGDLSLAGNARRVGNRLADDLVPTPVEFGGVNILPADRVKQPQKGLFGQIIVEPLGATVTVDAATRTKATVSVPARAATDTLPAMPARSYTDFALVWQKMMNYRYASGNAVQNESEEGPGLPENPPHTVMNAANYRAEPTFFRFGIPPLSAAGGAGCAAPITAPFAGPATQKTCFGAVVNAGDLFSNSLTGGADPQTPVFTVGAKSPFRIHLTSPNSSNRGTTFTLHGHVWPRDPYLAQRRDAAGFPLPADGTKLTGGVGSVDIGDNPMQFYLGAQESVIGSAHFSFVLPSAGGVDGVTGDYLFRDTAAAGMGGGAWGIVRVQ
jgi:hypothetical protein